MSRIKTKSRGKVKAKTVYVVQKYIIDRSTGQEIRFEDYSQQFDTPGGAKPLMAAKQQKYFETVEAYLEDGIEPEEGRRYEIVPIKVPT